jgi:phenylacetic acid degradation operon negative regulatory protein
LTLLGELVLPAGGAAWTQTIVRTLELLDVEEKNARQALVRVAEDGLIESVRDGRRARWHLTPAGRGLLTEGTRRIYSFGDATDQWDDHWLVVLFSVPEEQRAKRPALRTKLAFAGFGFLGPGVAITPHLDREPLATAALKELDLVEGAVVWRAEAGDLVPAVELLHRAWDVDGLAATYRQFLAAFDRRAPTTGEGRLGALIALVHAWRRFPFIDPEIPDRLLPGHWPGRRARALFDRQHEAWAADARRQFAAYEALE